MQKVAKKCKKAQKSAKSVLFFAKKCVKSAFFCVFARIPARLMLCGHHRSAIKREGLVTCDLNNKKSEIRISKFEINSKHKIQNTKQN